MEGGGRGFRGGARPARAGGGEAPLPALLLRAMCSSWEPGAGTQGGEQRRPHLPAGTRLLLLLLNCCCFAGRAGGAGHLQHWRKRHGGGRALRRHARRRRLHCSDRAVGGLLLLGLDLIAYRFAACRHGSSGLLAAPFTSPCRCRFGRRRLAALRSLACGSSRPGHRCSTATRTLPRLLRCRAGCVGLALASGRHRRCWGWLAGLQVRLCRVAAPVRFDLTGSRQLCERCCRQGGVFC